LKASLAVREATTGAEARTDSKTYAALKGPLFHGCSGMAEFLQPGVKPRPSKQNHSAAGELTPFQDCFKLARYRTGMGCRAGKKQVLRFAQDDNAWK
jgi:hypothetical protein